MDESTWLTSEDPQAMLSFLRDGGKLTERKARLFAVAACRRIWHLLPDERSQKAIEVAELFADGLATSQDLRDAYEAAFHAISDSTTLGGAEYHARLATWWTTAADSPFTEEPEEVISRVFGATVCDPNDPEVEDAAQAALLREIIGPWPVRPLPLLDATVVAWNDGCIPKLAASIYEENDFSQERMGVLADALEEGGVTDAALLEHLRGPGGHVKGCWVVDLLTGRG